MDSQALENVMKLSNEDELFSIQIPVLGAVYGRFELEDFMHLFMSALKKELRSLKKIWLVVPQQDCSKALSILKENQ
jgi:hypothetical protein